MYIDVFIVRSMHGTVRSFGNFIFRSLYKLLFMSSRVFLSDLLGLLTR